MLLTILGGCLIGGGAKGLIDGLFRPVRRPIHDHGLAYSNRSST